MTPRRKRRRGGGRRAAYRAQRPQTFSEPHAPSALSALELTRLVFAVEDEVALAGCDGTLRHALAYVRRAGLNERAVVDDLRRLGGYCDCEVGWNIGPRLLGWLRAEGNAP